MSITTPIWVWLPGQNEPAQAGELLTKGSATRFIYHSEYIQTPQTSALDPTELPFTRSTKGTAILGSDGLPGVVRDAKPAGYGADRIRALYGDQLTALELLGQPLISRPIW